MLVAGTPLTFSATGAFAFQTGFPQDPPDGGTDFDFSLPLGPGLDYLSLSPLLKQVFFIGDGQTDGGVLQQVIVPTGASRLYLATMDMWGWYNNSGSFAVNVGPVPLPSTILLLGSGLLGLGSLRRFRKR